MKSSFFASAFGVAALLSFSGCSRQEKSDPAAEAPPAVHVQEAHDLSVVQIDHPERFQLATAGARTEAAELNVTGVVSPDVNRQVPVNVLTSGRAIDLKVKLGDDVRKGQLLLRLTSPDLSSAFSDYQKAAADELLARTQLERSQLLYSHGAIAQKDLQVAEDTEQKAKVDLSTAAERVRILGGDIRHPSPILDVYAPESGTIVEQNVTNSAAVKTPDNSPNLFTIANLARVWILCDVYENDLSKVHLGDSADVRLNAYPDRVLRGRVGNIGRVLDPNTRSAKVRLELDNPGMIMRTGMFVTATFRSQTGRERAVVPATAVLHLHDKDWVFEPVAQGRFRRIEVQAGPLQGKEQVILAGITPGQRVVSDALQLSNAGEQ